MRSSRPSAGRRKSDLFLLFLLSVLLLWTAASVHLTVRQQRDAGMAAFNKSIVERYGLTDLCLFTEARYARHPSQADITTPFQDHPVSLEHFPAGAMAGIPPQIRRQSGTLH